MTQARKLRIVVTEDDEFNLFILMKTLKDAGHNIIEFQDGFDAWSYLSTHADEVDMVILDKMMIKVHAMEVVSLMKAHSVLKETPIIIQSGEAFPEKISEMLDAGIDRYITKPYNGAKLLALIQELAEKFGLGK